MRGAPPEALRKSPAWRRLRYADDRLFATLDPATRRVALPSGRACRLADTVGFIQKLPTKLVASFASTRAETERIPETLLAEL